MVALTLEELADAVGGRVDAVGDGAHRAVEGPVVIDSRDVVPGALFVALAGERVDGHDYAQAAVAAGAAGVLAARPVGVPAVVVDDVLTALSRLAAHSLARLPQVQVTAITGSSGKTSTKDLLAQVLDRLGPTVATRGSYNNEIGAPLTVLRADASTRHLVVEMGARGVGHIASLCRMAPPDRSIVLNVGSAHVGEFGSREAIAQAKGEIVEALAADGLAVLNGDDPLVRAMADRTPARVVLVGEGAGCAVRAESVALDEQGRPSFELVVAPELSGTGAEARASVRLELHGEHHVANALAVAAVALDAGLAADAVADALSSARALSRWRMEVTTRPDGVIVVNDAYNANPESVRAALKSLVAMGRGRRTWAVLGEMLELGASSVTEHDGIGRLAVRLDVSKLVAVGEGARPIHVGAGLEGSWGEESAWVPDAESALALLREEVRPGDVVLVKASRAAGLERVAEALVADVAPPDVPADAAQGAGA